MARQDAVQRHELQIVMVRADPKMRGARHRVRHRSAVRDENAGRGTMEGQHRVTPRRRARDGRVHLRQMTLDPADQSDLRAATV